MPRKPLLYSPEFPYHIVARTNNREWFKGHIKKVWEIFSEEISKLNEEYSFSPHAFVLMSNHYHMIASCSAKHDLGYIMMLLQKRTAIRINELVGRINHCYGGRYKGALIRHPAYYANAYKYLCRNPIQAGACKSVGEWPYLASSILDVCGNNNIPVSCHAFEKPLVRFEKDIPGWLNQSFLPQDYDRLKKASKKTEFKFARSTPYRLPLL